MIIYNYTYVSCHDVYDHERTTLPWPLLEDFARERPLCLGAYGGLGQGGTWALDLAADSQPDDEGRTQSCWNLT